MHDTWLLSFPRGCHRRSSAETSVPGHISESGSEKLHTQRPSIVSYPDSHLRHNYQYTLIAFVLSIIITFLFFHHEAVSRSAHLLESFSFIPNMNPLPVRSRIILPEVNGGVVYRIPPSMNRFHTIWFRAPAIHLRTPTQSKHRYLYSPERRGSSDGIGHSMGTVNLEMNIALRFNLTYTHRVAEYSSLTQFDPSAVERFFGWGDREIPRTFIQSEGCLPRNGSWPDATSLYECMPCGAPAVNGTMHIQHVVEIPKPLGAACRLRPTCMQETIEFMEKHSHSHTIFQLPSSVCSPPATDPALLNTKYIFYYNYWEKHGIIPWKSQPTAPKPQRPIRLLPQELNIAMHIRRGDFLIPGTGRTADIIHDEIFASLLQNTLMAIYQVGGPFVSLPVAVHIYSEGKLMKDKVRSTHDTNVQNKNYYDSRGKIRDIHWWEHLIYEKGEKNPRGASRAFRPRLRFQFHISEETLLSAHEMISADIFIGSLSGMSIYLIWSTSRGVALVPRSGAIGKEFSHYGPLCCSVPFRKEDGHFSLSLLRRFWGAYSRANRDTVVKHLPETSTGNGSTAS